MPKPIIRIVLGVIIAFSLVVLVSGCAKKPEIDVSEVRAYADPITENALLAMNENDYAKFSEHFDETMKKAMPEAVFNQAIPAIKAKIGDYVSKDFWKVEKKGAYTIVYYKAKYTEEPADVIVTVSFQEIEGEMYISGLLLNSPKLREK